MTFKHKDKEYTLGPIGLQNRLEHLAWLRLQVMAEVKAQMIGLPLELCKHIWDEARKESKAIEIGTHEYQIACCKFDALAKALQLATDPKEITVKESIDILGRDIDTIGPAIMFDVLNFSKAS